QSFNGTPIRSIFSLICFSMVEIITQESDFSKAEIAEFFIKKTLLLYDEKIAMFYSMHLWFNLNKK
ncbi:MAG TPA: hypothetical protein DIS75_03965, partial [Chryseobacterium sp.]|nr:hypothetical protein [Chryseobacterium sp.]